MSTRLGMLGGMFDPVHNGHIEAARHAMGMLELDSLHLVPCHIPHHRNAAASSPEHRLKMLQLATQGCPGMMVNPIELNRNQISYSVDTLQALRDETGSGQLVFICGMDAFNTLPQWHQWQKLFALCHFFVVARDGAGVSQDIASAVDLVIRRVHSAAALYAAPAGKIWLAEDFRIDVSSTAVRAAIQAGQDLSVLLDARVSEYIGHNNLYGALR